MFLFVCDIVQQRTCFSEAQPLNLGTVTFHFAAIMSQVELVPPPSDLNAKVDSDLDQVRWMGQL